MICKTPTKNCKGPKVARTTARRPLCRRKVSRIAVYAKIANEHFGALLLDQCFGSVGGGLGNHNDHWHGQVTPGVGHRDT